MQSNTKKDLKTYLVPNSVLRINLLDILKEGSAYFTPKLGFKYRASFSIIVWRVLSHTAYDENSAEGARLPASEVYTILPCKGYVGEQKWKCNRFSR